MTHIIWIQTSFIGDIILNTAAFALAARILPGVQQHLVTTRVGVQALAGHTHLQSQIVFQKRQGGVVRAMRHVYQDLIKRLPANDDDIFILQAHRSFRSSLLASYLKYKLRKRGGGTAPQIYTYDETQGGYLADRRVPRIAILHEAARISLLLEPLGASREQVVQARPSMQALPLNLPDSDESRSIPQWQAELAQAASHYKLIGIAPGSMWGTKRWTSEGFAQLLQLLWRDADVGIVLLGSSQETALVQDILASIPAHDRPADARLWNLCGQTSFDDLRRVYPHLALVVSNDSSPVHYAAAFNVPTVAIFGATVPEMGFAPLAARSTSVGIELNCRPCSAHGPEVCPLGHFKCMRELSASTVYYACRQLLKGAS